MPHDAPSEPWLSFLNDLDAALDENTELHCMGGFAIVQAYGLGRATADIDVLSVVPYSSSGRLLDLAGKESALRNKHGIYLDVVTVATAPEDYTARVVPAPFLDSFRSCLDHSFIRLKWCSEKHDVPIGQRRLRRCYRVHTFLC